VALLDVSIYRRASRKKLYLTRSKIIISTILSLRLHYLTTLFNITLERSRKGKSKGAVSHEIEKPQASNLSKAFTLHYRNIPVNWSKERSFTICRTRHIVILHIYLTIRHNNIYNLISQPRSYRVATILILRSRCCSQIILIVGNVKSWYG
jgi:hypothetical protein